MTSTKRDPSTSRWASLVRDPRRTANALAIAIIVVGTLIRIPQLFHNLVEAYAFRQTQTAFTVREFAENGIDLLSSPLPVFGPDANVPMEFPLFQGIGALLAQAGTSAEFAARLVSLVSFQVAAILLFLILRRWHGRAVAVTALLLYQFLPFSLLWGASSLIDFMSVALALGMVYLLDRWFDGGRGSWWFLAAGGLAAVLCALVKITTFPGWVILVVIAALILIHRAGFRYSWWRVLLGLIVVPAIGLAAGVTWTRHADAIKASRELTHFIVSSELNEWNFGTLAQRLDLENYLQIAQRVMQEIAGPALLGGVLAILAAIFARSFAERARIIGWIAVAVVVPFVFFNLYVVHTYYLIGIFPALVAATAIGLVWLWRRVAGSWKRPLVAATVGLGIFLGSMYTTPAGISDIYQWARGGQIPDQVTAIRALSEPDDLIVLIGCDWDPTWLYTADRRGVMFRDATSGSFWYDHEIQDYSLLFTCNPALDANAYLPVDTKLESTEYPYLFRLR